jgi:hypothetical protein
MRRYFLVPGVLVATLLATGPALARKATGGLQGSVVDENGKPLPGVMVIVTSPSLRGERLAVTGADGQFHLALLPKRACRVAFELAGFEPAELGGVRVDPDTSVTLEVALRPALPTSGAATAGAPVDDVTSTAPREAPRKR